MSRQLEQLQVRKKNIEQRIKEARKRERERNRKRDEKRLQAMGRFVRNNEELYSRFLNEALPKLPAYLRKLFEQEAKKGATTKKRAARKTATKPRKKTGAKTKTKTRTRKAK